MSLLESVKIVEGLSINPITTGNNTETIYIDLILAPSNISKFKLYFTENNLLEFDKLLEDYKNDNSKNPFKIIIEYIINNFEIYMKLTDYSLRFIDMSKYCLINNIKDIDKTLYIESIEKLINVYSNINKNELFLCFLNDILIKLKLTTEIIITDILNLNNSSFFNLIKTAYINKNNSRNKCIKIGYINNESKPYCNSLADYNIEKEFNNLIKLIEYPIIFSTYKELHYNKTILPEEIKNILYDIFIKLYINI